MSEWTSLPLLPTWQFARLDDVAQLIRGVIYKKEEARSSNAAGFVPVLRATNITGMSLTFDDLVYVPKARVDVEQMLMLGDVVVASSSGSKEVVGKAGQLVGKSYSGSFGGFCTAVRPNAEMLASFIGYYFQSSEYRKAISDISAGSNINNIKSSDFAQHLIPVAPRAEQTRIVEKLEELLGGLDAAVTELKAAQRKLTHYRQSLLKAAMEGALTEAWRSSPSPCPRSGQGEVGRGLLLPSDKSTPPPTLPFAFGEREGAGNRHRPAAPHPARTPHPLGRKAAGEVRPSRQNPAERLASQVPRTCHAEYHQFACAAGGVGVGEWRAAIHMGERRFLANIRTTRRKHFCIRW